MNFFAGGFFSRDRVFGGELNAGNELQTTRIRGGLSFFYAGDRIVIREGDRCQSGVRGGGDNFFRGERAVRFGGVHMQINGFFFHI